MNDFISELVARIEELSLRPLEYEYAAHGIKINTNIDYDNIILDINPGLRSWHYRITVDTEKVRVENAEISLANPGMFKEIKNELSKLLQTNLKAEKKKLEKDIRISNRMLETVKRALTTHS